MTNFTEISQEICTLLLGLFTSAIQALVFATLAGAYIGESVEDHH